MSCWKLGLMISEWVITIYDLHTNGVYWGYNPGTTVTFY